MEVTVIGTGTIFATIGLALILIVQGKLKEHAAEAVLMATDMTLFVAIYGNDSEKVEAARAYNAMQKRLGIKELREVHLHMSKIAARITIRQRMNSGAGRA